MKLYTLNEASAKLKEHKIIADSRKLIREALAGKLWLSIGVHGHYYSPTIFAKCENLVGKYLDKLQGIESNSEELSDDITCKFEAELIKELLNSLEWSNLSKDQKISYLIRSDSVKSMYQRYSNPSIGGYLLLYPKQLLTNTEGTFRIEYLTDRKNDYCVFKTITPNDLLIDEYHLHRYIQSLTDKPKTTKKTTRLYSEIEVAIPKWLSLNFNSLCKLLEEMKNKEGSCITNVDYVQKFVEWLDYKNGKHSTDFKSIQKKIKRTNGDIMDKKDSITN